MLKLRYSLLLILLFGAGMLKAQLPETVIYLLDVQRNPKGYKVLNPRIISSKSGYNNQPWFSIDGQSLYYVHGMDTVNTEIFRYDLRKKKSRRVTRTGEAEYSPKLTRDFERISCVRVEKDRETQRLYTYSLKGKKPVAIWPELRRIGYYDWITQQDILSFELPEPFVLVRRNIVRRTADTLATHVGRTFYNLRSKGKMVYVDKTDSTKWVIRTIAKENLMKSYTGPKVENPVLWETLPGEDDYCFMQDGSVMMGHEGKLFVLKNPFKHTDSRWTEFADLNPYGVPRFYRIALSPDNTLLAVVAYLGKKP